MWVEGRRPNPPENVSIKNLLQVKSSVDRSIPHSLSKVQSILEDPTAMWPCAHAWRCGNESLFIKEGFDPRLGSLCVSLTSRRRGAYIWICIYSQGIVSNPQSLCSTLGASTNTSRFGSLTRGFQDLPASLGSLSYQSGDPKPCWSQKVRLKPDTTHSLSLSTPSGLPPSYNPETSALYKTECSHKAEIGFSCL